MPRDLIPKSRGRDSVMADAKAGQAAPDKSAVESSSSVVDPDAGMQSQPGAGFNKSARAKRRPGIRP